MRCLIVFCFCVWLIDASSLRYKITGASSEIAYSKALLDNKSAGFLKYSDIVRRSLQEALKSTRAAVNVYSFRNSRSEHEEETSGAQFIATVDVDATQYPTQQHVKSVLTAQTNEALRIFKTEPSDHIWHDDEPTSYGWNAALSFTVSPNAAIAPYCQNGGILLPNNTCYCLPYFQGANCEIRVCLNGGFATKSSPRCYCPPGYGGLHCEPLPCMPITQSTFDFSTKSLMYVINTRDSMAYDINSLINATINITDFYQSTRPGYFDSFQLTSVLAYNNGNNTFFNSEVYMTPQDFLLGLESLHISGGDAYQPILTGILNALSSSRSIHAQSPVYIFADAMASDVQLEAQVIQTTLAWGTQLFFFISQPPSAEYSFDSNDDGVQVYYRLAKATQGEVLFVGPQKQLVDPAIRAVLPYQYDTETIVNANALNCTTKRYQSIIVDPGAQAVYAYAVGGSLVLMTDDNHLAQPNITIGIPPNIILEVYVLDPSIRNLTFYRVSLGPCSYRVFVASDKSVVIGYTNNLFIDVTSSVINAGYPHAIVARVNVPNWTNMSVSFISEDDQTTLITPSTNYTTRPGSCAFPELFPPWPVCTVGPFNVLVHINSPSGTIQRMLPGYCFPAQPPLNPTSAPPNCQNGGTPLTHACACPELYTGRNCEVTLCINGATPNPAQSPGQPACYCMPGYTGAHCEHLQCNPNSPFPSFDLSQKTFALVVEQTFTMAAAIAEMAKAVANLTSVYAAQNPGYFSNFTLTTFLTKTVPNGPQNQVVINTTFYTDGAQFAQAAHLGGTFTQATTHPVMEAIYSTLVDYQGNIIIKQRSPVFILLDSEPSDVQYMSQVQDVIIHTQTPLYFIITSPYHTMSNCLSPTGPGMIALRQLAAASGGLVINFCNQTFSDTAVQLFMTYLGSIQYRLETISQIDLLDCSGGIQEPFGVESPMATYYVSLQSNGGTLSVKPIAGNATMLTPYLSLPGFKLYRLNGLSPNIDSVMVSGVAGACSLRIQEPSFLSVFYGFTPNPSIDAQSNVAMLGKLEHPVVHLSSALQSAPELTVAIMDQDYKALYYSSSEIRNDLCHYDYFMTGGFVCSHPFQYFYMKFIINGDVQAQRTAIGYCKGVQPGSCLNGGAYNPVIAQCQCYGSWSGQFCQTPLCFNGGYVRTQDQTCICPFGFSGDHCELGSCSSFNILASGAPPVNFYKSVAFVVQNSADSSAIRQQLVNSLKLYLFNSEISQEKQFILVTFTTTSVTNVISTSDSKIFASTFNKTLAPGTQDDEGAGDGKALPQALEALLAAVELTLFQPAIIFVFANAPPSVDSHANTDLLIRLGLASIQVNFIISPTSSQPVASNDPGTAIMNQLAAYTDGRVLYVTTDNLGILFGTYLAATADENGFVSEYIFPNCSNDGNVAYFPIESSASWFTVTAVGYMAQLQLVDPLGHQILLNDSNVAVNDSGSFIVAIFNGTVDHYAGYWTVMVKSASPMAGACNVQIRVASILQLSIGYVLNATSDFPIMQPYAGGNTTNRAIVSIAGQTAALVTLKYFKAFTINGIAGTTNLIDTATMHMRDSSCAYQWYSDIFSSPQTGFGAEIIGTDPSGFPFKRVQANYFIPPNCNNGGHQNSYGGCDCAPNWTGLDCSVPICLNGGTLDAFVCNCAPGYYGIHCEAVVTPSSPTTPLPTTTTTAGPQQTTTTTAGPPQTTTTTAGPSQTTTTTAGPQQTTTTTAGPSQTTTTTAGPLQTTTTTAGPQQTTTTTAGPQQTTTTTAGPQQTTTTTAGPQQTTTTTAGPQQTTTTTAGPQQTTTTTAGPQQTTTTTAGPQHTTTTTAGPQQTTTTTAGPQQTTTTTAGPSQTTTTTVGPQQTTTTTAGPPQTTTTVGCNLKTAQYDVVFFFDVSRLALAVTLPWQKNIATMYTQNFAFGNTLSQFSPASYATDAYIFGRFDTYTNQNQFEILVNVTIGNLGIDSNSLNFGTALKSLNNSILTPQDGLRPNSNHLIIFFASKNIDDVATAQQMANSFRNMNPPFHILGIASNQGVAANITPLAGGASCVTSLDSAADVPKVVNWLVQKVCSQSFC